MPSPPRRSVATTSSEAVSSSLNARQLVHQHVGVPAAAPARHPQPAGRHKPDPERLLRAGHHCGGGDVHGLLERGDADPARGVGGWSGVEDDGGGRLARIDVGADHQFARPRAGRPVHEAEILTGRVPPQGVDLQSPGRAPSGLPVRVTRGCAGQGRQRPGPRSDVQGVDRRQPLPAPGESERIRSDHLDGTQPDHTAPAGVQGQLERPVTRAGQPGDRDGHDRARRVQPIRRIRICGTGSGAMTGAGAPDRRRTPFPPGLHQVRRGQQPPNAGGARHRSIRPGGGRAVRQVQGERRRGPPGQVADRYG